ncbi:MAG: hypothetical protein JSW41_01945 [Candidatus Aenigmatarchaeota archaeon]|nr:MAG: hypothetical protein JSW41_01945 [Candidatus Aenigmarchaeota archaeon]
MGITDVFKAADKISEAVDDNILSQEEKENILTRRLEIDANSDNQLAKMIRPLITLIAAGMWVVLHTAVIFTEVPSEALYSADAVFMTCIGFYFDARRREKVAQRRAIANIKINKERVKHERVREKREARLERIRARKGK